MGRPTSVTVTSTLLLAVVETVRVDVVNTVEVVGTVDLTVAVVGLAVRMDRIVVVGAVSKQEQAEVTILPAYGFMELETLHVVDLTAPRFMTVST